MQASKLAVMQASKVTLQWQCGRICGWSGGDKWPVSGSRMSDSILGQSWLLARTPRYTGQRPIRTGQHGIMAQGSQLTLPPCCSARAAAQHQGGGRQRAGRRGGLARPRPAQRRDPPVQRVCQVQYSILQYSTVRYSTVQYSTAPACPCRRGSADCAGGTPGPARR